MRIAIIGAGYTGTMTACALSTQHDVTLIDPKPFGLGVAYSTPFDYHLLNVPAGKMSALADKPDDFVKWLAAHHYANPSFEGEPLANHFISRRIYGLYIKSKLETAVAKDNIETIQDEAIDLINHQDQWQVHYRRHPEQNFDKVILCLGNPAPDSNFLNLNHPGLITNPWDWNKIKNIQTNAHVCILGTGLTMVDVVLSLHQSNHQGPITAISRHGYIPKAHDLTAKPQALHYETKSPRQWLKSVRNEAQNCDNWRSAIDGLRPFTQSIWQDFSLKQQKQFLRHMRSVWDIHRHRIAKPIADTLENLQSTKQLDIRAGRIKSIESAQSKLNLRYQPRHQPSLQVINSDVMINCMGPSSNYHKIDSTLIQSLLNQQIIKTCPIQLGLHTNASGQAYNHQGQLQPNLWCLGPPTKGIFWEIIAVPDLRNQIRQLFQLFA